MCRKSTEERVVDLENLAQTLAPLPAEVAAMGGRFGNVEGRLV